MGHAVEAKCWTRPSNKGGLQQPRRPTWKTQAYWKRRRDLPLAHSLRNCSQQPGSGQSQEPGALGPCASGWCLSHHGCLPGRKAEVALDSRPSDADRMFGTSMGFTHGAAHLPLSLQKQKREWRQNRGLGTLCPQAPAGWGTRSSTADRERIPKDQARPHPRLHVPAPSQSPCRC